MIAKILKKTGEYETVPVDVEGETVDQQREILEEVKSVEVTEENRDLILKNVKLRAIILKRETGYDHIVKID
ncbi:hypothetical protein B4O97_03425 [Marispirochaeta aestuarii]|uniref:Uncharacterized protein n=1 Tax=Marispirochaeta aestuarii TaxID=1963862 RepID=A0A1Y1S1E4_9SPIO|nr:hypothetical protein [Marispirochaeta aestuarii]ORC37253.1 hypothetical protein B4O97_03425 [Marispirochaeta aestuarii]